MSTSSNRPDNRGPVAVTINFAERFAHSDQFDKVFKHGMALVERAAAYLDGPGRQEAKQLKSPLTLVYATESMRLTTRLLELASWLLIRRGVKDGEITPTEAAMRRERVKLQPLGRPSHVKHFDDLPQGLRDLIAESFALNERILQLDRALTAEPKMPIATDSGVDAQIKSLHAAFGAPRLVSSNSTNH